MDFDEFKNKYQKVPVELYPTSVTDYPVVSVCVQTYQHSNYIKDCLESILMQETDFSYEILLGEDASNDGTREICIEYAEKYPDRIRLFLHNRENNIKIAGQPTGRFNFLYNLYSTRGKYIALCEGDDYWTDSKKLHKQVEFMERNKKYSICFHPVKIYLQNENELLEDYITRDVPLTSDIYELAKGNYIHTPSVLFRNYNIASLPAELYESPIGDYFLYMLVAQKGLIKKLYDAMAVYRVHDEGIWSKKSKSKKILMYLNLLIDYFEDEQVIKLLKNRRSKIKRSSYLAKLKSFFKMVKNYIV